MNKSELQYLSDTILVEKIAAMEFGLTKQAGLADSLGLDGIASSIKNFVGEHVNSEAPGGYVGGVLGLMAPAVLWRINPFVGILYLVASQFGFNIQGVVSKIIEAIRPKLQRGEKISTEEINSIGKSIVAGEVGTTAEAAPSDLLAPLRAMEISGELQKQSADPMDAMKAFFGQRTSTLPSTPLLSGGGGSPIQRIFGTLFNLPGRGRGKWLLGGFIIWIIKTVLAGAGLLAGAEAISGLLGHKKPTETKPVEQKVETPQESTPAGSSYVQVPKAKPNKTQSTNELWVVPLVGNGVEDTLVAWALDLYPNLDKYDHIENIINSTPSFRATAALLKKDPTRLGRRSLVMPKEFSIRQDVVNTFIDDVIRNLK